MGLRWFLGVTGGALALLVSLFAAYSLTAQEPAVVSVDAPATVASASTFTVQVDVTTVTNFDIAQFDVVFYYYASYVRDFFIAFFGPFVTESVASYDAPGMDDYVLADLYVFAYGYI